ncbi:MAG: bifunctional 5,10-methylenetetrahydrofolate dehydrogenase/5,10-methenyltetrahydrofolate cyclohydrolase [Candidatus Nomurabacteria bacterium]|nr:MAG: bifunctional 5,10-methylenetetrahydrofolate dehydrogenase/5,10-methenyltetrahydrofolate cyclohydrolase [Candidatus Nomurabacteria bacterium]
MFTTQLIDGRALAKEITDRTAAQLAKISGTPGLAIILVGNDPASEVYVKVKERACEKLGIHFALHRFPADANEADVLRKLEELNSDAKVHGIVVQLPLPSHLNEDRITQAIDWRKDVDGFHPMNVERYLTGQSGQAPSLIRSIMALLQKTDEQMNNKEALVLAYSDTFFLPMRKALESVGLQVSAQRADEMQVDDVKKADVVIIAAGKSKYLRGDMLKPKSILIDVGINEMPDGSVTGDVDAESVEGVAAWRSPVPGGVGPVTVAMLLQSTVEAFIVKEKAPHSLR